MPVSKNKRKSKNARTAKRKRSRLVVTVSHYGPNDKVATKLVAVAIHEASKEIKEMKKWFSESGIDVRELPEVVEEVGDFIRKWNPHTVVSPDAIIGCPHEEGIDYPDNEECAVCPFWRGRDRFTGEYLQ